MRYEGLKLPAAVLMATVGAYALTAHLGSEKKPVSGPAYCEANPGSKLGPVPESYPLPEIARQLQVNPRQLELGFTVQAICKATFTRSEINKAEVTVNDLSDNCLVIDTLPSVGKMENPLSTTNQIEALCATPELPLPAADEQIV